MARKPGTWDIDLEAYAKAVGETVEDTHRAVCISLFNRVVADTPVDTGHLRGAWVLTNNTPGGNAVFTGAPDKTGERVMAEVKGFTYETGGTVFFTNPLPYAVVAEYGEWGGPTELVTPEGYSRKSPQGMVRKNVAAISTIVNDAVKTARRRKRIIRR